MGSPGSVDWKSIMVLVNARGVHSVTWPYHTAMSPWLLVVSGEMSILSAVVTFPPLMYTLELSCSVLSRSELLRGSWQCPPLLRWLGAGFSPVLHPLVQLYPPPLLIPCSEEGNLAPDTAGPLRGVIHQSLLQQESVPHSRWHGVFAI